MFDPKFWYTTELIKTNYFLHPSKNYNLFPVRMLHISDAFTGLWSTFKYKSFCP